MKAVYPNKPINTQRLKRWFASKWNLIKSLDKREAIITITIVLTILLFMYTAVSKLLNHSMFVFQMRRSPISFMQEWAPTIGWTVPSIELVLVILLFLERTRLWGMISSLLLMLSFEVYISWMKIVELQTGIKLPCTCGGIISDMGWTAHLLFNAVFIFLLGMSIYYERKLRKSGTV